MKFKYIRNISNDGKTADIYLFDEIYYGYGREFVNELKWIDENGNFDLINVYINSPGGTVIDGLSIFFAILNTNTSINTIIAGIAASIAGIIAMAGDKVYMIDYGKFMLHNVTSNDPNDKKAIKAMQDSLLKILSNKTGLKKIELEQMMNEETWLDAKTAKSKGFIDGIKEVKLSQENNISKIENFFKSKFEPTKTAKKMDLICNYLTFSFLFLKKQLNAFLLK